METWPRHSTKYKVLRYAIIGAFVGLLYANIEYLIDSQTDDVEQYIPLLIRGFCVGLLVGASAMLVEVRLREMFRQRPFYYLVLVRAILYTLIITLSLLMVNSVWFIIREISGSSTFELQINAYIHNRMYLINLLTIFGAIIVFGSLDQINSLHRKGELWSFITGRYHRPHEVERIFCFIDLKGSTALTERLGDITYASFLKDYYSDISDAIRHTQAQIYQYVGDEIVLSWAPTDGLKDQNCIACFFKMYTDLYHKKDHYLEKYGAVPGFRAGLHIGKCIVTWVGEVKREIVYIGDVLNTTARIQELCKVHESDFLASETLLMRLKNDHGFSTKFIEEIVPRGKTVPIRIYSIENDERNSNVNKNQQYEYQ